MSSSVIFSRYLPIVSFCVGATALIVQTTLLYPYHNDLDAEFKQLKDSKDKMDIKTEEYSRKTLEHMGHLEKKVNHLMEDYERLHGTRKDFV